MHARGHLYVSRFAQRTTNIIKVKLKLKLDERKGNFGPDVFRLGEGNYLHLDKGCGAGKFPMFYKVKLKNP